MFYSYFNIKNKHKKTLNYIKSNIDSIDDKLAIRKKINKLNDYQFFFLISDLTNNLSHDQFIENALELFFTKDEIILNTEEYFYLKKNDRLNEFKPFIVEDVSFNYKKDIDPLIDYFLETKEYPKETHLTKLLVLSDNIFQFIFHPALNFKFFIDEYLEQKIDFEKNESYSFLNGVLNTIDNTLNNVLRLSERIQKKIDSLSKTNIKNGNYQIDINSSDLRQLYYDLEKIMLIDQNKTSLNQFIEVFENDWESHNSIIYFEMDNILFKYFIDFLETYFEIKIQLSTIEYSAKIANKNGIIKAGAIYSSMAQYRKFTKERDDINTLKSMFEKIKKH